MDFSVDDIRIKSSTGIGAQDLIERYDATTPGGGPPRLFSQPFLEKPPLSLWLDAGAIRAFGGTPWAVRLASAFAGLFAVALVAQARDGAALPVRASGALR